jgi:anti-sigma regulatory factor (Ser/Thr protein kinase)
MYPTARGNAPNAPAAAGERAALAGRRPAADTRGLALTDRADADRIRHVGWLYRDAAEHQAGIEEFLGAAVRSGEPTLVALPAGLLPPGGATIDPAVVSFADMTAVGRNPARIPAALKAFANRYPGRRVRFLGEPAWPGRTAAELREVSRYEALLNVVLADADISILCPYNAAELPASVVSAARRTHPLLLGGGSELASDHYRDPADMPGELGPLRRVPRSARALAYERDLRPVRAMVRATAGHAGLSAERSTDLVIAASEVAANTLKHTSGGGVVRAWVTEHEVLCQLEDAGHIADPLAGLSQPAAGLAGSQGLWLVNQVCDLAEIRTSELGTTIRLHMYRDGPSGRVTNSARTGSA